MAEVTKTVGMIEQINRQFDTIDVDTRTGVLWLVSVPFFLLGWLVGFLWRCILWCIAALLAGFNSGKG